MSGVILDQAGQPVAGEARQQMTVQGQQAITAAPIASISAQVMASLLQGHAAGKSKEELEYIRSIYNEERAYEKKALFNEAMASAKAEMPMIKKTKHVGFKAKKEGSKDTSYDHEDLADVIRVTDPVLGKYGLSSSFRVSNAINQPISVTCVIKHRAGHEDDSNTLVAGKDDSGGKNQIQQVSSTITYLKRYTLMAALGLAAEGDDDDGRGSEVMQNEPKITAAQVETIETLIAALPNSHVTRDTDGLLGQLKIESLEDLPASAYEDCLGRIATAKAKREAAAAAALKQTQAATDDANKIKDDAVHAARTTTPGGQGRMI